MSNFLAVLTCGGVGQRVAAALFDRGVAVARTLKRQVPSQTVETAWVRTAAFPRRNGSGGKIAIDPASGSWILPAGVWFHADGYGEGSESRLLSRYLEVGPLVLARELEGFFCVVIGDVARQELVVITDVVGSYHCFLRRTDEGLALSGSSLLLAGLKDFHLDPIGCQEFVATGVIYEQRCLYQDIRKLGPATILRVCADGSTSEQRYWHAGEVGTEVLDGARAVTALWEALVAAVGNVARVYRRPVCDLTGGYDSRALVAALLGSGQRFAVTVSGAADSADVVTSKGIAALFGLEHLHARNTPVTFAAAEEALTLTDGEYDLLEYARIEQTHELLARRFDISLNGSFGEIARGYWWELLFPRIGARARLDGVKLARLRFAAGPHDLRIFASATRLDLVPHFAAIVDRVNAELRDAPNTLQMDNAYLTLRMQRWQGRIASSTNQLWPCLSPFLFRSALEVMLKVRPRRRLRSLLIREMLAAFQPRLAAYPLEHGYPAMPATWKTLHRFSPLLKHYGERLLRKAKRTARWHRSACAESAELDTGVSRPWEDEGMEELMDPQAMRLTCLMDHEALARFLERSHSADFPYRAQWARLLSLETALRALERTGVRPVG